MPWYRLEFRHGPGHMATDIMFEWFNHELTEAEEQEFWHEKIDPCWDNSIHGECRKADNLSQKVLDEKLNYYRRMKQHCESMIAIITRGS